VLLVSPCERCPPGPRRAPPSALRGRGGPLARCAGAGAPSRRVAHAARLLAALLAAAAARRARPLPEAVIRSVRGGSRVAPAERASAAAAPFARKGPGAPPPPAAHALLQRSRKKQRGWPRGGACRLSCLRVLQRGLLSGGTSGVFARECTSLPRPAAVDAPRCSRRRRLGLRSGAGTAELRAGGAGAAAHRLTARAQA
jgi:hypothetical protein